jgi:hypothetical protein
MRLALLTLLSAAALGAAEPSAFGAGNLDSPAPYGLTPSEKHILKNKEMLDTVKKTTAYPTVNVKQPRENSPRKRRAGDRKEPQRSELKPSAA